MSLEKKSSTQSLLRLNQNKIYQSLFLLNSYGPSTEGKEKKKKKKTYMGLCDNALSIYSVKEWEKDNLKRGKKKTQLIKTYFVGF